MLVIYECFLSLHPSDTTRKHYIFVQSSGSLGTLPSVVPWYFPKSSSLWRLDKQGTFSCTYYCTEMSPLRWRRTTHPLFAFSFLYSRCEWGHSTANKRKYEYWNGKRLCSLGGDIWAHISQERPPLRAEGSVQLVRDGWVTGLKSRPLLVIVHSR